MVEPFVPLPIPRPPPTPHLLHTEPRAWTSVTNIARHHLDPPVTHVSFNPQAPYDLAATGAMSVSLIGSRAGTLRRTLERFRYTPYCANFKPDGRLLVAAAGNGARVFDLGSRAVLRTFTAHKSPVHSAMFSSDGRRVMTASDDTVVKAWDLATSRCLVSLTDATDNVRCQNSSPASHHVWISGSHDRKARLYDLRSSQCLFTLDHGAQVDDVHILPGGARAVTVGGMYVRVWDFFMGGEVVQSLNCHAKAVSSAAVCAAGNVLVTAGLDACVKIHDLSSFQTRGRMHFESEVLSVDLSKDGVKYAVGMANGMVDLRSVKSSKKHVSSVPQSTDRREREFEGYGRGFEKVWKEPRTPRPGTQRYFDRGKHVQPSETDLVVKHARQVKLAEYDRFLRKFRHEDALDAAVRTLKPAVVVAVVDELMIRGRLTGALEMKDIEGLRPILGVIRRNIRKPRYSQSLIHVMNVILDLHAAKFGDDVQVEKDARAILFAVQREIRACRELSSLEGSAETILSAAGGVS